MKFKLAGIALIAILIPSISLGFGGFNLEHGLFWGTDLDRNGRIDRIEAKNAFNLADQNIFDRYDANGNGTINQVEFNEFIQQAPWNNWAS